MHIFPKQVQESWVSHYDTMLCPSSHSAIVSTHLWRNPIIAWISLADIVWNIKHQTPIVSSINKIFEHQESLLTFTCITWKCSLYFYCHICHILPPKTKMRSIYLYLDVCLLIDIQMDCDICILQKWLNLINI